MQVGNYAVWREADEAGVGVRWGACRFDVVAVMLQDGPAEFQTFDIVIYQKNAGHQEKSIAAITSCGICWFQPSGTLSKGRLKLLVSPGCRPPMRRLTMGTRSRTSTCPETSRKTQLTSTTFTTRSP